MTLSELREAARYRVSVDSNLEWLTPAQLLALCDAAEALPAMLDRFGDERDPCEKIVCRKARAALSALRDSGLEVT